MSQLDDLSKLFQRFGGKAEAYKEIVREDAAAQARERWPLLSAVRVDGAAPVPPVHATAQAAAASVAPVASPATTAAITSAMTPIANPGVAPAMAPRFRTPEGMPPAPQTLDQAVPVVPPASGPRAGPAFGPASGPTPAAELAAASRSAAAWRQPHPADPERTSPFQPAPPVATGTELSRVFARLEGRPEPAPASERVPARRSFLDRLTRS